MDGHFFFLVLFALSFCIHLYSSLSELRELVMNREAWRAAIHGVAKSRTWLSDWTKLNWVFCLLTFGLCGVSMFEVDVKCLSPLFYSDGDIKNKSKPISKPVTELTKVWIWHKIHIVLPSHVYGYMSLFKE